MLGGWPVLFLPSECCAERRVEPGCAQGAGSGMQRFYNYMYMCTTARVLRGESRFKPAVDSAGMQRFYKYVYIYMFRYGVSLLFSPTQFFVHKI